MNFLDENGLRRLWAQIILKLNSKVPDGGTTGQILKKTETGTEWADDKSAYTAAQEGGYTGAEAEFNAALASTPGHIADSDIHVTNEEKTAWSAKQDALIGTQGQVVGFNESGNAVAQDANYAPASHVDDGVKHITADERNKWNDKSALNLTDGINSIMTSRYGIGINPAVNGAGYAVARGATATVTIRGCTREVSPSALEAMFDGKSNTFIRFQTPDSYFSGGCRWTDAKEYKAGDIVIYYNSGRYHKYFQALANNTGVTPEGNPDTWEDISVSSSYSTNASVRFDDTDIVLEVSLPFSVQYENGCNLYWRSAAQKAGYVKIESFGEGNNAWSVEEEDNNPKYIGSYYFKVGGTGAKYKLRFTFRALNNTTTWTALAQIAITGVNVGGIEGVLVNRGGSTMYGPLLLSGNPTSNLQAAPKQYVDAAKTDLSEAIAAVSSEIDLHEKDTSIHLPSTTEADNGKFLRVVDGVWTAVEIPNANGGSF